MKAPMINKTVIPSEGEESGSIDTYSILALMLIRPDPSPSTALRVGMTSYGQMSFCPRAYS